MNTIVASSLVSAALLASPLAHADDAPIADNSFFVEEAYNQEAGVVQHIQSMQLDLRSRDWGYMLTEEWPAPDEEHQVSVAIPVIRADGETGLGDVMINYRRELFHGERVVVTPRASLWLRPQQEGAAAAGVQLQACVSIHAAAALVMHSNVGITAPLASGTADDSYATLAQSVIWLAHPRFNLLLEATSSLPTVSMDERAWQLIVSPGVRTALDFSSGLQIVPGLAAPVSIDADQHAWGLFLYLSFEHPLQSSRKEG